MTFKKPPTANPDETGVSGSIAGETGANPANGIGDAGGMRWPCLHGPDCDGRGLDCGPDFSRKKPAPKPAAELADIRARAWATRRAKYGPSGHYGSYTR